MDQVGNHNCRCAAVGGDCGALSDPSTQPSATASAKVDYVRRGRAQHWRPYSAPQPGATIYAITIEYNGRTVRQTVNAVSAIAARNKVIRANWSDDQWEQVVRKCR